ncbi:MAG: MarR family winged helix-turn-helix transcriptional regulator [Syntrophomonadaceae bacterium]
MNADQDFLMMLFSISKALRFCQQEEICGESITFIQFNIMNLISDSQRMKMAELHAALSVDKSTTTRLIEPLVNRNLIIKEKSPEDSRVVMLRLSEEGQEMRDRAWECLKGFINSVEARIPAEQRAGIYQAVRLFTDALQESCCSCSCRPYIVRCEL